LPFSGQKAEKNLENPHFNLQYFPDLKDGVIPKQLTAV